MSLQKVVEDLARKAQEKELEEYKKAISENMIKTMSAVFSEAQRYTNIVIIAGYAAFFTMWGSMKDRMPEQGMFWAAILMMISVGLFIAFETYKMILNSNTFGKLTPILKVPPDKFKAALNAYTVEMGQIALSFRRTWIVSLILIVSSGYSAWAIMIWHFILRLVQGSDQIAT